MKIKELKFSKIMNGIIGEINAAKTKAESIYGAGNIKSSGDEIENLIREKISLFLPERYLVKQGHIVNSEGRVSKQFDIIIFDRLSTPKFFESQNKTVFYPIESVLAIGEIKKTLRKNDLIEFGKKIKHLKVDMKRKLNENSIFGGKLNSKSSFFDIVNMRTNKKYKNPLFSFLFAIDEEGFDDLLIDDDYKFMPNDVYILNYGFFIFGNIKEKRIITKIEDENPIMDTWIESKKPGISCLGMMFNQIINHLNSCQISPFSISNYMTTTEDFMISGSDIKIYKMKKQKSE
ncbi:MAG: hypothetical protein HQ534_03375 [Armatimonadetes bacterium]|nr:hypothetical protein [Armatimonadota bacterium]